MLVTRNLFALTMLLAVPSVALAQEEDADPAAEGSEGAGAPTSADGDSGTSASETAGTPKTAEVAAASAAANEEDQPFAIRRGLYAEADLGVYFTFGGRNTNDPNLVYPGKGISNVQPYLGVFFGYDLVTAPKYSFAAGVKLAAGYSGGAGRVDASEVVPGSNTTGERSNDFGIYQAGVGVSFGYLVNDRLAVTIKADGGMAAIDPDPSRFAADPAAGSATFSGMAAGGLGVEYFTLLNDFSVGLDARFAAIFHSGLIPSMSITIPVKYTF